MPEARAALDLQAATGAILSQFLHREAAVREAAIAALASVARAGPLPLPIGEEDTGMSLDKATSLEGSGLSRIGVVRQLEAVALAATAAAAAAEETAQAAAAQRAGGSRAPASAAITLAAAAGGVAVEAAVACLGAIAAGERLAAEGVGSTPEATSAGEPAAPPPTPAVMRAALAALLRLSPNRSESVQFAVGAALVEACGGAEATGPHSLVGARSSGRAAAAAAPASAALDSLDAAAMADAPSLPGFSGAADRSAPGAPDGSSAAAALRDACVSRVLDAVLGGPLVSVRATERAAAAVWLLALTYGLGARSTELRRRLGELHGAFMRLLGEKSPFVQVRCVGRWGRGGCGGEFPTAHPCTLPLSCLHPLRPQEVAGKGLSIVYDCGGASEQRSLVSDLVSSFDTGRRAAAAAAAHVPAAASASDPTLLMAAIPAPPPVGSVGSAAGGGAAGAGPAGLSLSAAGQGDVSPSVTLPHIPLSLPPHQATARTASCAPWPTRRGSPTSSTASSRSGMLRGPQSPCLPCHHLTVPLAFTLSSHHAAWHTRGGAGVALEALLSSRAKAALLPHLQVRGVPGSIRVPGATRVP